MCSPSVSRLPSGHIPIFSMCRVAVVNRSKLRFIDPRGAIATGAVKISPNCRVWGWVAASQLDLFNVQLFTPPTC